MAYKDFRLSEIQTKFGIDTIYADVWKKNEVQLVKPSAYLSQSIALADLIPLTTEKALSERILAPILAEVKATHIDQIQVFSGEIITADRSVGLNGEIDFLLVKKPYSTEPSAPIISVTEAKIGRIDKAIPQAAAQMIGARVFNQLHGEPIETIHGVVTDGNTWRFLRLQDKTIFVDNIKYSLVEIEYILGIFQAIIEFYK
jgi:hypothetical protein